jgi:hypothetical protein
MNTNQWATFPIKPRNDMTLEEQQKRLENIPDVKAVALYNTGAPFFRVALEDTEETTGRYVRALCAIALDTDAESLRST